MTGFVIIIPTTREPAELVSISEEHPDINSVICLTDTFDALPISSDYDAFVRKPTGIIQKIIGDHSFRVDISSPITNGRSWQLGITLGHIIHNLGALKSLIDADPKTDTLIFVSGSVSPNLKITPVNNISEKCKNSESLLQNWKNRGGKIKCLFHEKNIDDVNFLFDEEIEKLKVTSLKDTLESLGLPQIKPHSYHALGRMRFFHWYTLIIGASIMLLAITFFPKEDVIGWHALEMNGQHKDLIRSLKDASNTGNWLETNAAFFFRYAMRLQSTNIEDNLIISLKQNSCSDDNTPRLIVKSLPENLKFNCETTLIVENQSDKAINVWLKFYPHEDKISKMSGMRVRAKETNEIENISLKSPTSTLIFSATHRKDQDVIDWLGDTWPYDQNLLKRARYRFLNTGIAFQVFTFAGTEKKLNSN